MRLKKIAQWAVIALLATILFMLGVNYINDKQTQRRNESDAQREEAIQPGGIQGQAGNTGYIAGIDRYKEDLKSFGIIMPGAAWGDQRVTLCELQEYTDHEGEQTENSLTLLSTGGDIRIDPGGNSDADPYDGALTFKVTQYTAGYESTGKRPGDSAYGITYSGATVKENHTIAADPDVLPIGTKVRIEGLPGTYVVEDTGSKVNGNHIDIYTKDLKDAMEWGVQKRRVIILKLGAAELGP